MKAKWLLILGTVAIVLVLGQYAYVKFKNKASFSPSDWLEVGGAAAVATGVFLTYK